MIYDIFKIIAFRLNYVIFFIKKRRISVKAFLFFLTVKILFKIEFGNSIEYYVFLKIINRIRNAKFNVKISIPSLCDCI